MLKTEISENETAGQVHDAMPASACMECLFWYRCRGSKLDCLFRAPLAQANRVRA